MSLKPTCCLLYNSKWDQLYACCKQHPPHPTQHAHKFWASPQETILIWSLNNSYKGGFCCLPCDLILMGHGKFMSKLKTIPLVTEDNSWGKFHLLQQYTWIIYRCICLSCFWFIIKHPVQEDLDVSCSEGKFILILQQIYSASTRIQTSL